MAFKILHTAPLRGLEENVKYNNSGSEGRAYSAAFTTLYSQIDTPMVLKDWEQKTVQGQILSAYINIKFSWLSN